MLDRLRNKAGGTATAFYRRFISFFDRFTGPEGQLPIPLVILMVPVGFILLPVMILFLIGRFCLYWPRNRAKRWALCLFLPFAIYWGIYLVTIPFYIAWAQHIGENICEMAKRGELSKVTVDNPPSGIAGLGPDSAKKLRDLEPAIAELCVIRAWPDSFEDTFYTGLYHLRLSGPGKQGLASVSLYLHHHPTCTPFAVLVTGILPIPGGGPSLTEFSYWPIKDEDDRARRF